MSKSKARPKWMTVGSTRPALIILALVAGLVSQLPTLGSDWLDNIARVRWLALYIESSGRPSKPQLASLERILDRAVVLNPGNRPAYQLLGFVYEAAGNSTEAARAWRLARASPFFIERGQIAYRREDFIEALTWFQRAVHTAPEQSEPWYFLGLAQTGLEQWDPAITSMQAAVDINSFASGKLGLSDAYFRLGEIYRRTEPENAIDIYEHALALNHYGDVQNKALTFYQLGQMAQHSGEHQKAISYFQQALQYTPEHYWSHLRLGMSYVETGKWDLAETELTLAKDIAPGSKWSYLQLGNLYTEIGQNEDAKVMFEKALAIDPSDGTAQEALKRLD